MSGPKKTKGRHRAAKYTVFAILFLLILFGVVNGTLFILGLGGVNIPPAQLTSGNIGMTLNVPNQSFVPINGRIVTHVYDATTGQLLGTGDNPYNLAPDAVTPVSISIPMNSNAISNNPIKVTMDYYIGAYGYTVPYPYSVSVTLPPA